MINVSSSKLIIDVYMSPYLVLLLILDFFPDRLAELPYGLDSNVTKLYSQPINQAICILFLPIESCNLVSIKIIIIIIIIINGMW